MSNASKPTDPATLLGIYHGATPERIESKIRALLDLEGEVSLYLSGEASRNDLSAALYRAFNAFPHEAIPAHPLGAVPSAAQSPCEDIDCACNACRVIRVKRHQRITPCPYGFVTTEDPHMTTTKGDEGRVAGLIERAEAAERLSQATADGLRAAQKLRDEALAELDIWQQRADRMRPLQDALRALARDPSCDAHVAKVVLMVKDIWW